MKEFIARTVLIFFLASAAFNVMADCYPTSEECGPDDDLTGC